MTEQAIHIDFTAEHYTVITDTRTALEILIEDAKRLSEHTDEVVSSLEVVFEPCREVANFLI